MNRCLLALAALAVLVCGCNEPDAKKKDNTEPAADGKKPVVVITTNFGVIKAELFPKEAPITVRNFLVYVDDKHYDGTIFHRVIGLPHGHDDFMIQGDGFGKGFGSARTKADHDKYRRKTGEGIKNEGGNGLLNERGTLAMARTQDPDSATDQFFINLKHNAFLDRDTSPDGVGYAVFGKVIDGMDVVDKIKKVRTKAILGGGMTDVPVEDVVIESIRRQE